VNNFQNENKGKKENNKKYKASFDAFTLKTSISPAVCGYLILNQAEKATSVMEAIKEGCPESLVVRYEMNQKGIFLIELILDPDLFEDSSDVEHFIKKQRIIQKETE